MGYSNFLVVVVGVPHAQGRCVVNPNKRQASPYSPLRTEGLDTLLVSAQSGWGSPPHASTVAIAWERVKCSSSGRPPLPLPLPQGCCLLLCFCPYPTSLPSAHPEAAGKEGLVRLSGTGAPLPLTPGSPLPASVFLTLELPAKNKVAPKGCSESVGGCGPGGPGASVSLCGLGRACTVQKGAEGLLGTTCWHQGGQRQEGPPQILPPVLEAVGSWRADENPRFGDE